MLWVHRGAGGSKRGDSCTVLAFIVWVKRALTTRPVWNGWGLADRNSDPFQ